MDADAAFFDPDRSHADHLRAALEARVAEDGRRAAKYGYSGYGGGAHTVDWPRGTTPEDVRAAYDEKLSAAMREMKEATVESEDEGTEGDGVRPLPRVVGAAGELATPPTSGDEGEMGGGKRKRGCGDGEVGYDCGGKKMRLDTDLATFGRHLATPQLSSKRKSYAPRRLPSRSRRAIAAGIELYNTHAMTTRSKARRGRHSG